MRKMLRNSPIANLHPVQWSGEAAIDSGTKNAIKGEVKPLNNREQYGVEEEEATYLTP